MSTLAELHAACAARGIRLFTVTAPDEIAAVHRRVYTSHPDLYPLHGTKPLDRDGWHDLCVATRRPFVANSPDAFRAHFSDHALIVGLGLGSCANLPVLCGGAVRATVNLLAGEGHFTAEWLAACQELVARAEPAVLAAAESGATGTGPTA